MVNASLTVWIGAKPIEVIQNPTSIQMRQLVKEFRRNLIHFPVGTMAVRYGFDLKGNKYMWESHRATHDMMAPSLGRLVGEVITKKESENKSQTPSKVG